MALIKKRRRNLKQQQKIGQCAICWSKGIRSEDRTFFSYRKPIRALRTVLTNGNTNGKKATTAA